MIIHTRFWKKVNKEGPLIKPELGNCWEWTGALDKDCYGRFNMRSVGGMSSEPAFRVAWVWENGPVPPGMQLDHLCKWNACVRPSHLEVVTPFINNSRAHRKGKGELS